MRKYESTCVKHHYIQAYLDFMTYPYKFQRPLLLLLVKNHSLFADF